MPGGAPLRGAHHDLGRGDLRSGDGVRGAGARAAALAPCALIVLLIGLALAISGCAATPPAATPAEVSALSLDELEAQYTTWANSRPRSEAIDQYTRRLRREILARRDDITPEHRRMIVIQKVAEGFGTDEVLLAWGYPDVAERPESSPFGTVTRWRWGPESYPDREVTFRDERVLWWTDRVHPGGGAGE